MTGSLIGLQDLNHYCLKHSVTMYEKYNALVIRDNTTFNNLFYSDAAAGEKTITPDFNGQMVVALFIRGEGSEEQTIRFHKADINGRFVNLYSSTENGQTVGNNLLHAVATIPKSADVRTANFYLDGKLVKTISIADANNILAEADNNPGKPATEKIVRKKPVVI